jgi:hypothetical protein
VRFGPKSIEDMFHHRAHQALDASSRWLVLAACLLIVLEACWTAEVWVMVGGRMVSNAALSVYSLPAANAKVAVIAEFSVADALAGRVMLIARLQCVVVRGEGWRQGQP